MIDLNLIEDPEGAPYPDEVQGAARDVARRMSGCPDPVCFACQNNRAALEALVHAVDAAVREVLKG